MKLQNNHQLITSKTLTKLWSFTAKERFNCIRLGTIFRQTGSSLIVGGEDGNIRIYDLPITGSSSKPQVVLESKSGPIQTMCVHDITKFYHNDLLVADSQGLLTVFCNKQILSRQTISTDCINSLQVLQDSTGCSQIITGTDTGVITASLPASELWRINFNDVHTTNQSDPSKLVTITSMLVVDLSDQCGVISTYLLVADSASMLHVINQGTIVMTLKSPAIITAMSAGRFINSSKLGVQTPTAGSNTSITSKISQQVALGSRTGAVYILHNFSITLDEFANCKCPITELSVLKMPDKETDYLLCCGHINSLLVFQDGKVYCEYEMPDWINTIDTCDIDNDGLTEIVVGCLDNSILALKLTD
ncbi:hypothetical protein SNE40_009114 [Patella caerulea]|uniref:Uncharacterized protein n=1 Tax=Patella caerulea TaxID=87958 RepID=A0AAN8JTD5_PATCE